MADQIAAGLLQILAARVVKKLGGKKPADQSVQDAAQDASLYILERWATGERKESHLVMFAWGKLTDKYARLFAHNARTSGESARLWNVRAGRKTDEPDVTIRGSYGRTALFAPSPTERTTPVESTDTRLDLETALLSLTALQATVFRQCAMEGRKQTDVAKERGISRHAVVRILQRAKARLRTLLGDYNEHRSAR